MFNPSFQGKAFIDGPVLPRPEAQGHLYIPVYNIDAAIATQWDVPLPSRDGTAKGVIAKMRRAGISNIRILHSLADTEMRPGWYAPFSVDSSSGDTIGTSGNIRNHSITTGYLQWNIPAGVVESNRLVVLGTSSNANADIVRVRGGVDTTLATVSSWGSSYAVPVVVTLSDTLLPGDSIKIVRNGASGTVAVWAIWIYASSGLPNNMNHRVSVGTQTEATIGGSSFECAYEIAPAGSTPAFVGGAAHQDGSTFNAEVNIVEAWTKAGSSWSVESGYWIDNLVFTRHSDVRYKATSTLFAELDYIYTPLPNMLKVQNELVATAAMDSANLYPMMLPGDIAVVTTGYTDQGDTWTTTGTTLDIDTKLSWEKTTPLGLGIYMYAVMNQEPYLINAGAGGMKVYYRPKPITAANSPIGTTYGGYCYVFADDPDGATEPLSYPNEVAYIALSPVPQYWSPTITGGSVTQTITLTANNGPVTFGTPFASIVNSGATFAILGTGSCEDGLILQDGDSCTIDVSFTSSVPGSYSDVLRVFSSASDSPKNIPIAAIVVNPVAVTDNFNRADGSLGSNWTTVTGQSAPSIASNGVVSASAARRGAYWSADSFSGDQYAQITFSTPSDNAGVLLRAQAGAQTTYIIMRNAATTFNIAKLVNGSWQTNIASNIAAGKTWASGDTLKATISGTSPATFEVFVNGTSRGTWTDSSPLTGGKPGLYVYDTVAKLDDFAGGDL